MEIVDAQVHIWEPDRPGRPWDAAFRRSGWPIARSEAVGDAFLVETMDRLGVKAAVVVSTSHYGWDCGYWLEAAARHPGRLGVVGRLDPSAPDLEDLVGAWRMHPFALGLRVLLISDRDRDEVRGGRYRRLFAAAERHAVPICIYPPRHLADIVPIADAHPELQLVIDHLGLPQPPTVARDGDPWQRLPDLLALARYPNVAVKVSAAPALSREGFPYRDLWPHLHRIVTAFGAERLLWGTDWQRLRGLVTYEQGIRYLTETNELSPSDKEQLCGMTLRRVFGWPL